MDTQNAWCNVGYIVRIFRCPLTENLGLLPTQSINGHRSLIENDLHSAGLASCGLTSRVVTPCISDESLHLLDARHSIQAGSKYNEASLVARREINASLHRDREV